jgi:hypothetical protein
MERRGRIRTVWGQELGEPVRWGKRAWKLRPSGGPPGGAMVTPREAPRNCGRPCLESRGHRIAAPGVRQIEFTNAHPPATYCTTLFNRQASQNGGREPAPVAQKRLRGGRRGKDGTACARSSGCCGGGAQRSILDPGKSAVPSWPPDPGTVPRRESRTPREPTARAEHPPQGSPTQRVTAARSSRDE